MSLPSLQLAPPRTEHNVDGVEQPDPHQVDDRLLDRDPRRDRDRRDLSLDVRFDLDLRDRSRDRFLELRRFRSGDLR